MSQTGWSSPNRSRYVASACGISQTRIKFKYRDDQVLTVHDPKHSKVPLTTTRFLTVASTNTEKCQISRSHLRRPGSNCRECKHSKGSNGMEYGMHGRLLDRKWHGTRNAEYHPLDRKLGMRNAERGTRNWMRNAELECGIGSGMRNWNWNAECGIGMRNAELECGIGMWNAELECGMRKWNWNWKAECGTRNWNAELERGIGMRNAELERGIGMRNWNWNWNAECGTRNWNGEYGIGTRNWN